MKPGWKTSSFWMSLLAMAVSAGQQFLPALPHNSAATALGVAISGAAYALGRSHVVAAQAQSDPAAGGTLAALLPILGAIAAQAAAPANISAPVALSTVPAASASGAQGGTDVTAGRQNY